MTLSVNEKIKIANEYLIDKIPQSELAVKYKCSIRSISGYVSNVRNNRIMYKVGEHNISHTKFLSKNEKIKIVNDHLLNGIAIEELSRVNGCTVERIKKYIDRFKNNKPIDYRTEKNDPCKRVCRRLTLEEKTKIANEFLLDGVKQRELAVKYNCGISTVQLIIRNKQQEKQINDNETRSSGSSNDTTLTANKLSRELQDQH